MQDQNHQVEEEEGQSKSSPIELSDDEKEEKETKNPTTTLQAAGRSSDSAIDMTFEEEPQEPPPKEVKAASPVMGIRQKRRLQRNATAKDTASTTSSATANSVNNHTSSSRSEPSNVEKMRNLIWMAEYEAFQDPYRGISFLERVQKHAAAMENGEEGKEEESKEEDGHAVTEMPHPLHHKAITPWDACQFGILSSTVVADKVSQALRQPDMAVLERDGSWVLDPHNPESLVRNLTEAQCPSLLAWTRQKLEDDAKKRAAATKKRKGKKRPREDESSNNNKEPMTVCLGRRPADPNYRCPCDYNPFCLASLGGVVDDILQDRCERDVSVAIADDDNDDDDNGKDTKTKGTKTNSPVNQGNRESMLAYFTKKPKKGSDDNDNDEVMAIDSPSGSSASKPARKMHMDTMSGETERFHYGAKLENSDDKDTEKESESVSDEGVLVCKRLKPRKRKPISGDPADVYKKVLKEQRLEETNYSQATKEEMEKIRKPRLLKCDTIRRSLRVKLYQLPEDKRKTLDEYMKAIEEWHTSLLFVIPTEDEEVAPEGHINMALPPGIQNLGATCYLNTQLQCLAQNPVFLEGIFSWRAVNSRHNMNDVMTKLQNLLAQMVFGGDRKLSTLDFSNALGLEHYEQQDPNEFARLLFDRMEESFQQCSSGDSGEEGSEPDLSDLLRRIFHGTTTYETTCMECQKVSTRTEGFMDLNLPIVAPISDKSEIGNGHRSKRFKSGTIEAAFDKQNGNKNPDTSVQICLDQYLEAEYLDGDNQYFCENCNHKQDAQRITKLTGLPPVLNVQLSRYVFDREKFVKKKLTDKVLLPTVLTIDCGGNAKDCKRYALCAVMKHQGTSAYSGHYIAEAMDWTTGVWYEFNDETVKVLPNGPSSSYNPDVGDSSDSSSNRVDLSPSGSQDAYNMYYVDEKYLAQQGLDTIERRQTFAKEGFSGDKAKNSVLKDVLEERGRKYSILGEMCMFDWTVSDRHRRRKIGIRKSMFPGSGSLVPSADHTQFWVDGKSLRSFLSCRPEFDNALKSGEPIICPPSMLCIHGRLNPETAIQGKLLGRPAYDAYVSLLAGERKYLNDTGPEVNLESVVGTSVNASDNLICEECCAATRQNLTCKIESFRTFTDLFVALQDDKKESRLARDSEHYFLLSKSWATGFKKAFGSILKSIESFGEGDVADASKNNAQPVLSGLADICGAPLSRVSCSDASQVVKEGDVSGFAIDDTVNGKITCPHGNRVLASKNTVRFLSPETWSIVKKAFPNAIEHRLSNDDNVLDIPKDGCSACQQEEEAVQGLRDEVERWLTKTRANDALKKLLDDKRTSRREITLHNFNAADGRSRLVHRDDIRNLGKAVKVAKRVIKGTDAKQMKKSLESAAFRPFHSVVYEFEKESVGKLLSSLRSLICREHKQVISIAVFEHDDEGHSQNLSRNVAVLSEEEYHSYVESLIHLLGILLEDRSLELSDKGIGENKVLKDLEKTLFTYHPSLEKSVEEDLNKASTAMILTSPDGNYKSFGLSPVGICSCNTCSKEIAALLEQQKAEEEENIENVSVGSKGDESGSAPTASKVRASVAGAATNPIVVESDGEDSPNTIEIRVFEMKTGSTLEEARSDLRDAAGQKCVDGEGFASLLRRSSRKRKTIFPVGCITKETKVALALHYNLAAVRLLLFERCEIPLASQLFGMFIPSDGNILPFAVDLEPASNEKCLEEILNELRKNGNFKDNVDPNVKDKFFLLHQQRGEESGVVEASLLDSLLGMSNTESQKGENGDKNGKAKKKRASERGFRGTLLQSCSSAGNSNDDGQSNPSRNVEPDEQLKRGEKPPVSDEESVAEADTQEIKDKSSATESSDEEPILEPKQESPKPASVSEAGSAKSPLDVMEVDVDEEEEDDDDDEAASGEREDRFNAIFDSLRNIDRDDEVLDEVRLASAVEWAMANCASDENDEELKNSAFCKYLEYQDAVRSAQPEIVASPAESKSETEQKVKEVVIVLEGIFSDCKKRLDLHLAAKKAVRNNPKAPIDTLQHDAITALLEEN